MRTTLESSPACGSRGRLSICCVRTATSGSPGLAWNRLPSPGTCPKATFALVGREKGAEGSETSRTPCRVKRPFMQPARADAETQVDAVSHRDGAAQERIGRDA